MPYGAHSAARHSGLGGRRPVLQSQVFGAVDGGKARSKARGCRIACAAGRAARACCFVCLRFLSAGGWAGKRPAVHHSAGLFSPVPFAQPAHSYECGHAPANAPGAAADATRSCCARPPVWRTPKSCSSDRSALWSYGLLGHVPVAMRDFAIPLVAENRSKSPSNRHRVLESLANPAPPRRLHHRRTVAFPSCRASLPKAAPQAQLFASHSFNRPCPIRTGDADGILAGVSPTLPTQPPSCMCRAQATRRTVRVVCMHCGRCLGSRSQTPVRGAQRGTRAVAAVDVACVLPAHWLVCRGVLRPQQCRNAVSELRLPL